jgi:P-type Mg2+ transporter
LEKGFRLVAVVYKVMPGGIDEPRYAMQDKSDLPLLRYLAFLDPLKDSAMEALNKLKVLNADFGFQRRGNSQAVIRSSCLKIACWCWSRVCWKVTGCLVIA